MKKIQLRNIALAFIIINVWTLIGLFSAYKDWNFSGFSIYYYFFNTCLLLILLGILSLTFRILIQKRQAFRCKFKHNFFYSLIGYFNIYIFIIWIIIISMKIMFPSGSDSLLILLPLVFSFFIFIDIFFFKEKMEY
jgi:nitrogen fixation/metabolism regulation signal transduction histidine kinase